MTETLGRVIDIDWSEEALGFGNENVIVGLDENGLLVDCLLSFLSQCQAQQLQRADQWQAPTSMYIWDGRLYILDPPLFQIWRYEPSGGAYHDVPTEYFTGQGLPNIDEAVDFEITNTGDLFIQRSDGVLQKYRGVSSRASACWLSRVSRAAPMGSSSMNRVWIRQFTSPIRVRARWLRCHSGALSSLISVSLKSERWLS